jgi:hypothetical protein
MENAFGLSDQLEAQEVPLWHHPLVKAAFWQKLGEDDAKTEKEEPGSCL